MAAFDTVDPAFEWLDDGANYLLRLDLPGFRKEDFRVYVNTEGQLTVVAQRKPTPGSGGGGKWLRLRKAFQLPSTANLDAITGRFDGTVLMLTVPKLQQLPAAAAGPDDGAAAAAAALPTPPPAPPRGTKDETRLAAGPDDGAEERRAEAERTTLTAARSREEDEKATKPVAPPPQPPQQQSERATRGEEHREDQDEKARADARHREEVAREAARRIEAARARVAEAKAKAERERKCEHWKERAMEEGLKLADVLDKNKEAIATAVAAFTLGVFVSTRLFSRN